MTAYLGIRTLNFSTPTFHWKGKMSAFKAKGTPSLNRKPEASLRSFKPELSTRDHQHPVTICVKKPQAQYCTGLHPST